MGAGAIGHEDRLDRVLGQLCVDDFSMWKMVGSGNVRSGKLIWPAHIEQDEIMGAGGECMVDVPAIRFELQNGFKVGKGNGMRCCSYFGDDGHGRTRGWLVWGYYRCRWPVSIVA